MSFWKGLAGTMGGLMSNDPYLGQVYQGLQSGVMAGRAGQSAYDPETGELARNPNGWDAFLGLQSNEGGVPLGFKENMPTPYGGGGGAPSPTSAAAPYMAASDAFTQNYAPMGGIMGGGQPQSPYNLLDEELALDPFSFTR